MKKIIFTSIVLCCFFSACSGLMQRNDFDNFAEEFISNGTTSYEGFGMYCESKIETTVFIDNQYKKSFRDPSGAFRFLEQSFFNFHDYRVNSFIRQIHFKGVAYNVSTAILYFRRDDAGRWKLYKYETLQLIEKLSEILRRKQKIKNNKILLC